MQTKIKPLIAFLFAMAANAQTESKYTSTLRAGGSKTF
jgi:hypothetical protein